MEIPNLFGIFVIEKEINIRHMKNNLTLIRRGILLILIIIVLILLAFLGPHRIWKTSQQESPVKSELSSADSTMIEAKFIDIWGHAFLEEEDL